MDTNALYSAFAAVRPKKSGDFKSIAKPTLLLIALNRCYKKMPRLATLPEYEESLYLLSRFSQKINLLYPFKRLSANGLWEVEGGSNLRRNSSGDYYRGELLEKSIRAGFSRDLFDALTTDHKAVLTIANEVVLPSFCIEDQAILGAALPIVAIGLQHSDGLLSQRQYSKKEDSELMAKPDGKERSSHKDTNDFISYLNSLHNIGAAGANALAEAQALNRNFAELYEPFPVVDDIVSTLKAPEDCVVILTGHAGDGKSTVALDVLKQLRGLPLREPLSKALKEREIVEDVASSGRPITIVKDMSELSADKRLEWIQDAFGENGSCLIVSNTGPLLNSLNAFAERMQLLGSIENIILKQLNLPYVDGNIGAHKLDFFPRKDLYIVNMTRLDNVTGGARILTRMINHSGWSSCSDCSIYKSCPLVLNKNALRSTDGTAETRVRWIYRRLTAYEQRLTLRQMVAHLAYSLTGGMTCKSAKKTVKDSTSNGIERGTDGLEGILFSETFFGYWKGEPAKKAGALRAIDLVRREIFGGPIGSDFARQLGQGHGANWAVLPDELKHLGKQWALRAKESAGVRWRFAQRRMLYMFSNPISDNRSGLNTFLDAFLHSSRLRDFDNWTIQGKLTLGLGEKERLRDACLKVLLETYSGFSSGQFNSGQGQLYLTLRRPDRAVVQPSQLVMGVLSFRDFDLDYDGSRRVPLLCFKLQNICLPLTLPLLDYIEGRHFGELGGELAAIHLAQLEWFRSELLRANSDQYEASNVQLLRAGIDGEVHIHRYILDNENMKMEIMT